MAKSRSKEARKAAALGKVTGAVDTSDPEVAKWHKSKKQRAFEKSEARKERERQGREALKNLEEQKKLFDEHRAAEEEKKKVEEVTRQQRKKKVRSERDDAQRRRNVLAKAQGRALQDYQQELQQQNVEKQMEAHKQKRLDDEVRVARIAEDDMLRETTGLPAEKQAHHVPVTRTPELEYSRRLLPILNMEQEIMEAVNELTTNALMLCGETGSGKTTQLPQFLWEGGYGSGTRQEGMIGVTQPRRVAARSIAKRVAEELNEEFGKAVSYQVRYEHNLSAETKVKFMTEGILLKEIEADIALRQYSVIILDEAHERSIATDLLLGLLTRIVRLRWEMRKELSPLKLIIMSATLQVSSLSENRTLFPVPPRIIHVEARQHPVSKHFARQTNMHNYIEEAVHKIRQVHTKLPPGGVLVFMPTQRTIEQTVRKVNTYFSKRRVKYTADGGGGEWDAKKANWVSKKDKALNALEDRAEALGADEYGMTMSDYELPDMADDDDGGKEGKLRDDFLDVSGVDAGEYPSSEEEEPGLPEKKRVKGAAREAVMVDDEDEADAEEEEEDLEEAEEGEEDEEDEEDEEGEEAEEEADGDDAEEEEEGAEAMRLAPTLPINEKQLNPHADKQKGGKRKRTDPDDGVELEEEGEYDTVHVLPLYSLLNPVLQNRVFEAVPAGKRLVVVSTNIAETSLTIPGIRYVIDSGRAKQKTFDPATGVAKFDIQWISKASAEQRAGRAGRTGPGHVYRLFSTAVYSNECLDHTVPEILLSPLDSLVLFIKGFWDRSVLAFPFPTPPSGGAIRSSLQHLARLGALSETRDQYIVCPLGRAIATFPILPKYGKMLVMAKALMENGPTAERRGWLKGLQQPTLKKSQYENMFGTVVNIVCIASSMLDVFVVPGGADKETLTTFKDATKKFRRVGSDYLTALAALTAYMQHPGDKQKWCTENYLSYRNLKDAVELRRQIIQLLVSEESATDVYASIADEEEVTLSQHEKKQQLVKMTDLTAGIKTREVELLIRKLIACGLIDNVARRMTIEECELQKPPVKYNESARKAPYKQMLTNEVVYVNTHSAVAALIPAPDWVVYTALVKNKGAKGGTPKTVMKGVTAVKKEWLTELGWEGF